MDCFGSLPYCNALTREAPLRRQEKAERASDHYRRENVPVTYLLFQLMSVEHLSGNVNGDVTGWPSLTLNNGRATHGSSLPFGRQHSSQTAWLTVTLFSPHRVPSAAASSLERQEPFTEHQSVWQRFWKRKKTAAVWGRAELLRPRFSKVSHSFVQPLKDPCKGCISRGIRVFHKTGTTKGPNLGTHHYCAKRDYLTDKKWYFNGIKWIPCTLWVQIFS